MRVEWRVVFFSALLAAASACGGESDSLAGIRRTCAFRLSCGALTAGMGSTGGACVDQIEGDLARATMQPEVEYSLQCARNSTSCSTYVACTGRNHAPSYCAANPGESCDGTVLVSCPPNAASAMPTPGPDFTVDCTNAGGQCRATSGSPGGGHATCTNGNACSMSGTARCDGSRVISCDPALMVETVNDCASTGDVCETMTINPGFGMPVMIADCVPSTTVCTFPPVQRPRPTCDGTTLVECVPLAAQPHRMDGMSEGRVRRTDCTNAVLEGTCVTAGSGTPTATSGCAPANNQCAFDSPDRCNGNAVEYCVNGRYIATDCGSLGLSRCVQATRDRAFCVR